MVVIFNLFFFFSNVYKGIVKLGVFLSVNISSYTVLLGLLQHVRKVICCPGIRTDGTRDIVAPEDGVNEDVEVVCRQHHGSRLADIGLTGTTEHLTLDAYHLRVDLGRSRLVISLRSYYSQYQRQ